MRVVKAAAVQLSPVLYSREGTVEKVVRKIHDLGQQGVQFATFPETVVPYYREPARSLRQSGNPRRRPGSRREDRTSAEDGRVVRDGEWKQTKDKQKH